MEHVLIFDKDTNLWHFWATVIKLPATAGYSGRVWHFHSANESLESNFTTSGLAINVSETGFDAFGTFTPSAIKKLDGSWTLLYGGVQDGSAAHAENIGMATSNSPFGPWTKSKFNPVINYTESVQWCTNGLAARVDEAEPYIIDMNENKPRSLILVKSVCQNFTALPMLFVSKNPTQALFDPPFVPLRQTPIVLANQTANLKGFEQARVYSGPDGKLHMTGNDHGDGRQPHFVSSDGSFGTSWSFVSYLENFGTSPVKEPTPVYPKGTFPGDSMDSIPEYFLEFTGSPYHIDLMKNQWVG